MKITGHKTVTEQAVLELMRDCPDHPLVTGLSYARLGLHVVLRDIYDVLNTGHWQNFAQRHHFMRRFEGQTPYGAYEEGVKWIYSNARSASDHLAARIHFFISNPRQATSVSPGSACELSGMQPPTTWLARLGPLMLYDRGDSGWQDLGNALHALQDSFARGHVHREEPLNEHHPGAIVHILRYEGAEKEGHDEWDKRWWDEKKDGFSREGRLAVNASKALISLVLSTALNHLRGHSASEPPFENFRRQWLAASLRLRQGN